MAHRLIIQPDGLYAVFSTYDDNLLFWDATREEFIAHYAEEAAEKATERTVKWLDDPGPASQHHTVDEALGWIRKQHGKTEQRRAARNLRGDRKYGRKRRKTDTLPGGYNTRLDLPDRYDPDVVLGLIGERALMFHGFRVKMGSPRYKVFDQNLCCVDCGLEGKFFLLRKNPSPLIDYDGPPRAHFNLWGEAEDGTLILFTKDHIKPRHRGGKNTMLNYQTMCCVCNERKGDSYEAPSE